MRVAPMPLAEAGLPSWRDMEEPRQLEHDDDPRRLEIAYGQTFPKGDPASQAVIDDLTRRTTARCLGPTSSDAELRHLEGQRALVQHILIMVQRGREPS